MATASRSDALYVKFKPNSPFTVNREAVDFMAQHFAQDTTFVTHFALARLRDDIQAGLLNTANTLPVVIPNTPPYAKNLPTSSPPPCETTPPAPPDF